MYASLPNLDLTQILQLCGVLGFFMYVSAFAALQLQIIEGRSLTYTIANIAAASFVMLSLTVDFNLASALIQGCWIAIGLVGILVRLRSKSKLASTPTDSAQKSLLAG